MCAADRSGTAHVPLPQERRRRNRAAMVEQILDAARGVMREQGVAALSLGEVARRVRIRPQSLYEYFPSKAALYDALFLAGVRLYRERVEDAAEIHPLGWGRVRTWFEQYLRFAQEHPDLYQLVFERPVPGFVPSDASLAASRELLAAGVRDATAMAEAGLLVADLPPDRVTDLFIAMMHGLAALQLANEPHLPVGTGRFGGLVPAAIALFEASWRPGSAVATATPDQ